MSLSFRKYQYTKRVGWGCNVVRCRDKEEERNIGEQESKDGDALFLSRRAPIPMLLHCPRFFYISKRPPLEIVRVHGFGRPVRHARERERLGERLGAHRGHSVGQLFGWTSLAPW